MYEARMDVLTRWYDPSRPNILVAPDRLESFLQALFLWVEYYYKPAECNAGIYYFDDFEGKYDYVRTVFGPSLVEGQPSKTILTASRRAGKTQTMIVEIMPFLAVCRPHSCILLSEINDSRTVEELAKVKSQIEQNDRIHRDFGDRGVLWPRNSSSLKWTDHHMQFQHHFGAEIMAHSMGSAMRGRGPIYGVVDDPEDESCTFNREWRSRFINTLLNKYCGAFHWGAKILWIGTPIHKQSALQQAMRDVSDAADGSTEQLSAVDPRFSDWKKIKMSLMEKKNGQWYSRQPERLSVDSFLHILEINPLYAKAEILCEPVNPGERAFNLHAFDNFYMRCRSRDGEYFLDLNTGAKKPWDEFLSTLRIFAAGDIADGGIDSDLAACVVIGVDPDGIIYVLDCFARQCRFEDIALQGCLLAYQWNAERIVWEKSALQTVLNRLIKRIAQDLRKEGKEVPPVWEISNENRKKVHRILTLSPTIHKREMRFLKLHEVQDADGVTHIPVDNPHEVAYNELLSEIQEYSNSGINGPDDPIDALEMAFRTAGLVRGEVKEDWKDPNEEVLSKWKSLGVSLTPHNVPRDAWTDKMKQELENEERAFSRFQIRKRTRAGVLPWR